MSVPTPVNTKSRDRRDGQSIPVLRNGYDSEGPSLLNRVRERVVSEVKGPCPSQFHTHCLVPTEIRTSRRFTSCEDVTRLGLYEDNVIGTL